MDVRCCVWKKVRNGERWVPVGRRKLSSHGVSHGYCPKCAAAAFAEIRNSKTLFKLAAY